LAKVRTNASLLKARAIENMSFSIGVNRLGLMQMGIRIHWSYKQSIILNM
jgi:predicted amidohydrolase